MTLYEMLGEFQGCTKSEISRANRKAAKMFHTDKNKSDDSASKK